MNSKSIWRLRKHLTGLHVFIAIVLVLGIFFRFVNLDRKVYWHDETLTSLRIFGHTETELVQKAFDGEIITAEQLQQFQQPSSEKDLGDTLTALAGNAEHPPLYYLMARLWASWFGSSVAAMRSLTAVIGVLALPCAYWLCLELFGSAQVGLIAMAVIAISPFHVLYSQEAREYSLWTVTILLSSAALLKAIRLGKAVNWGLYAITIALGLYAHLLAVLVSVSHGIYVLLSKNLRDKAFKPYLLASGAGILSFTPWLIVVISGFFKIHDITAGSRRGLTFSSLIDKWFLNFNRIFLDHEQGSLNVLFVVLTAYSFYFLCRKTPRSVWLFVLSLTGVTALTLLLPDVILGGRRSTLMRYATPCCLGVQLAVSYLIATQLNGEKVRQRRIAKAFLAILITLGVIGNSLSAQADVWWTKSRDRSGHYLPVADILNGSNRPLLISDADPIALLATSRYLQPDTPMLLVFPPEIPRIPAYPGERFLFDASYRFRETLQTQQGFELMSIYAKAEVTHLWEIVEK
ncbi:glycosyltransferase family 39 protein [Oculatella sp. FACHB-28]|uniref:glycosyltransferase family 39 protein n=1 Tax=Oculatella sp. FACHB-28 TaxID=2692845 RepID=UPI00168890D0|nr:glycosyltransferase family 39 protein [Oculatella sp. FACHB-28]MBD2059722.1 glycosyltransferase family 39 protein [Oculatella sp. FACHB-28]